MDENNQEKSSIFGYLFCKEKWYEYFKNNKLCKQKSKKCKKVKDKYAGFTPQMSGNNFTSFPNDQRKNGFKKIYPDEKMQKNKLHYPRIGCSFYCSLESKRKKEKPNGNKFQEWRIIGEEVSDDVMLIVDSESQTSEIGNNASEVKINVSEINSNENEENTQFGIDNKDMIIMTASNNIFPDFCISNQNNVNSKNQTEDTRKEPFKTKVNNENRNEITSNIEEEKENRPLFKEDDLKYFEKMQVPNVPCSESMKNEIIPFLIRKSGDRKVSFVKSEYIDENYKPNDTIINYVHTLYNKPAQTDNNIELHKIVEKLTTLETKLDGLENQNKTFEMNNVKGKEQMTKQKTKTYDKSQLYKTEDKMTNLELKSDGFNNKKETFCEIIPDSKRNRARKETALSSLTTLTQQYREKVFQECNEISCKILKDCQEYYNIYYSP